MLECVRRVGAGDVEHGGRCVRGDHPVPRVGEVAGEQAAAAADLQDAITGPDRHEPEKAAAQAHLRRCAPADFQRVGELRGGGLRVDGAPDVGMLGAGAHRAGQPA